MNILLPLVSKVFTAFLMLGVVPAEGAPKLLARVGKFIIDRRGFTLDGALIDESVTRTKENPTEINYQAYHIDEAQVDKCIRLIRTVEEAQLKNVQIEQCLEEMSKPCKDKNGKEYKKLDKYISAYVLTGADKTYTATVLHEQPMQPLDDDQSIDKIVQNAQYVSPFNTCRTTALEITEWVLQFKTAISQFFYIVPRYQTTLRYGAPERDTFYILPAPPNVYAEHLSSEQRAVARQLYQQLENIPTQKLKDPRTRAKFNALKSTYLDIVGQHQLELTALLTKIEAHEANKSAELFARRAPCCFSQIACKFFDRPVTTKRVFDSIKADLRREIVLRRT